VNVWLYNRVSSDPRGIGRSVDEQNALGQEWAAREGWTVTNTISETGSASRHARRERLEWAAVLEAVADRKMDALITWEASRAQRDLQAYTKLRDACSTAGVLWGYSGTLYDLSKREDRFRTGLDALLAENEADQTAERVQRAVRANAEAGKVHGKLLYGYVRTYDAVSRELTSIEPHPEQAPIVREIFERVRGGEGSYAIAADLNRRGVPARRPVRNPKRANAGWTPVAVREVAIDRPAYAGLREYRGEILHDVEVQWPALIDKDEWYALRAVQDAKPKLSSAHWRVKYLLTGIAECAVCGAKMIKGHQNKGRAVAGQARVRYDSYACRGMRAGSVAHVTVSMPALDAYVTALVLGRLADPAYQSVLTDESPEGASEQSLLRQQVADDEAWLDQVAREAADTHDLAMLRQQRAIILPRIDAARTRIRQASIRSPRVLQLTGRDDLPELWDSFTIEDRRTIIADMVVPVIARAESPGRRGRVGERVTPIWL
jgi:site-specific DNA recombinase